MSDKSSNSKGINSKKSNHQNSNNSKQKTSSKTTLSKSNNAQKKTKPGKKPTTTNGMKLYIDHINQYPLLTKQQMTELSKEVQKGNQQALKYMMLCNTKLVITIAKKMQKRSNCGHVPLEDLIQYGNEGLYQACVGYRPEKGPAFSAYAGPYIRHTIKRNVENFGTVIRYPISFQNRMQKYKIAYQDLFQEKQREPTDEELAERAEITIKQVKEIKTWSLPSSIDLEIGDDKTTRIADLIDDPNAYADEIFYEREKKDEIKRLLKKDLDEREWKIVMMRLGMYDGQKHTLEEVGNYFGLSRERIRQIFDLSIKKLQADPEVYQKLFVYYQDAVSIDRLPDSSN